ncbi:hypothetical protein GUJ93_ZPchr0002g23900 [Zizania palustris]|uniref:Uncharacterized protein n=1 Tax=Zizania palustris TaxID=103762 RepID=A0A8J5S7R2_ZIZPA|nr:hypothetical protein GUJ93_ZPchr0002g23900 [Zizania palustris]
MMGAHGMASLERMAGLPAMRRSGRCAQEFSIPIPRHGTLLPLALALALAVVQSEAAAFATPAGSIVRQLSSVVEWPRGPSSSSQAPKQPSHSQYAERRRLWSVANLLLF